MLDTSTRTQAKSVPLLPPTPHDQIKEQLHLQKESANSVPCCYFFFLYHFINKKHNEQTVAKKAIPQNNNENKIKGVNGSNWWLSGVYGPCRDREKMVSWRNWLDDLGFVVITGVLEVISMS